jgi:hypothetical protein
MEFGLAVKRKQGDRTARYFAKKGKMFSELGLS